jgi:transglutaminase-like putative cysteine protease
MKGTRVLQHFLLNRQRNLQLILWAVFLYQIVIWFSHYWLEETAQIVKAVLWLALVLELLPLRRLTRTVLGLCAIYAVHFFVLPFPPYEKPVLTALDWFPLAAHYLAPLHPYIWFALAAWLVLLWAASRIVTRTGIIYTAVVSVIAVAIVDSYSLLILWDQAAVMIASGLMMLIVEHFGRLRRQHPDSWRHLRRYPGQVLMTFLLLFSAIVLAAILAPEAKPMVTDPYTAWKEWQGETVALPGKGIHIPPPADGSMSGYRRNDHELGGGFLFDHTPVMTVTANYPSYYRGEIRSVYTGKGWETGQRQRGDFIRVTADEPLPAANPQDGSAIETVEIRQTVTMQNEQSFPVLFAAYAPEKLVSVNGGPVAVQQARWNAEESVLLWRGEEYPLTYTAVSRVPAADAAELRKARAQFAEPERQREYLQLPPTLPDRVRELAEQLTSGETTDYDRVKKIESYLQSEFPYTNTPDVSKAESDDFVDSFLFEIREGYCDYYSTAMVVMLRSIGIPARWVKGFTAGSPETAPFPGPRGEEGPQGMYTIRNSDAHSWVEVYFQGAGWIPFEPTAGFSLPQMLPEEEEEGALADVSLPERMMEQAAGVTARWSYAVIVLLLSVPALVLACFLLLKKRRFPLLSRMRRSAADPDANSAVVNQFAALINYARKKGYPADNHRTARELISLWRTMNPGLDEPLSVLLPLYEKAKYGPFPVTADEAQRFAQAARSVRERMKAAGRDVLQRNRRL